MFNWFFKSKEKTYTEGQLLSLLEMIKNFNAGAIDKPLSRHVDKAFKEWKSMQK